jgi:hypothetical protein
VNAALADRATARDLALSQAQLMQSKNFFDLAHGLCSREHKQEHF